MFSRLEWVEAFGMRQAANKPFEFPRYARRTVNPSLRSGPPAAQGRRYASMAEGSDHLTKVFKKSDPLIFWRTHPIARIEP